MWAFLVVGFFIFTQLYQDVTLESFEDSFAVFFPVLCALLMDLTGAYTARALLFAWYLVYAVAYFLLLLHKKMI